jgi:hypothetical protein
MNTTVSRYNSALPRRGAPGRAVPAAGWRRSTTDAVRYQQQAGAAARRARLGAGAVCRSTPDDLRLSPRGPNRAQKAEAGVKSRRNLRRLLTPALSNDS